MDEKEQVREFLASRRAKIKPEQSGLPAYGGNRRVPGLRREEVAMLAGMSVDYYTRVERGNLSGVSESVLEALARALQLDDAERAHLYDLARAANASGTTRSRSRRVPSPTVRPAVQQILDSLDAPGFVRNGRRDILGANPLGLALYDDLFASTAERPVNIARFVFLNPRAHVFFSDWERSARDLVANLRTEAGHNPFDRELTDLVGELATRSDYFSALWAAHDVRFHRSGRKSMHHHAVGDLDLTFEALDLPGDPGLSLVVYGADVGSASADGLKLLASWAATRRDVTAQSAAGPEPGTGASDR